MSASPHQSSLAKQARNRATVSLSVRRESGLFVSSKGFWRLCLDNPDLRLERTAKGEVIAMSPAGADSGWRNAKLTMRLGSWTEANGTGEFFDSSTGFTLPNGAVKSPDATWISRARWDTVSSEDRLRFTNICPDFVVEITSPSDTLKDAREKMVEYIEQGVRLGWLLHPKEELAEIYRPGQPVRTLRRPASLSGEDVLPGFVLDLKDILFN